MRRTILVLTALATLLAGLAAPAAARQPQELAPLLDLALAAKVQGAERAAEALAAAPGQTEEKLLKRLEKYEAKLARFVEKAERGVGSERSLEVHGILAEGCNPGRGQGKKLGHAKEGHKFSLCETVGEWIPPGQLKEKPEGDDDEVEDDD
ncbi:MAG: hypothetical protein HKN46_03165 [Acidimicrobiia bacterium]|nr:hypothetical protein [Acidimicrobiia bacterium]